MSLFKVQIKPLKARLGRPFGNANRAWDRRDGLHLLLTDVHGRIGLGEASPLPGYSPDSLSQVESALLAFPWETVELSELRESPTAALEELVNRIPNGIPSARFALETALMDLLAKVEGGKRNPISEKQSSRSLKLLPSVPPQHWLGEAQALRPSSANGIKIKMGAFDFDDELEALFQIRLSLGRSFAIRLDANGSWSTEEARSRLEQLEPLGIEAIEEAVPWRHLAELGPSPVPLFLDESLQQQACREALPRLIEDGLVRGIVLKPSTLGGVSICRKLAKLAQSRGARALASHCFEGPVAFSALIRFAASLGSDQAHGIGAHPALSMRVSGPSRDLYVAGSRLSYGKHTTAHPDRLAILSPTGAWTWEELGEAADHWAQWLDALPPGRIGLSAHRSHQCMALCAAALDRGRTLVLLHPQWQEAEKKEALRLAPCVQVLDVIDLKRIAESWLRTDTKGPGNPGSNSPENSAKTAHNPNDCAAVVFSSGSTGLPKAVFLSRRAFETSAMAHWQSLGQDSADRWFCSLPLAHIGGFSILTRALCAGTGVILWPEGPFDGQAAFSLMQEHRATLASFVPTQVARLLAAQKGPPPESLRAVLVGGASLSSELGEEGHERGWPLLRTYGMTETCAGIAIQKGRANVLAGTSPHPLAPTQSKKPKPHEGPPIGPLLPGIQAEVRDGVLWVRGQTLANKVLGCEISPFENGWFCTGDRVRFDSMGRLYWLSRADHAISSGGETVHPHELERVLLAQPEVAEAVAFGRPHPEWGEALVAVVQPQADANLEAAELKTRLRSLLAPWKRPQDIAIVADLPRTATGKINRAEAARLL